jgi:murein DD-endopeptidase MepM/ murein hydrolase activator NlpD
VDTLYPVENITVPPEQSGLLDPALAQQEALIKQSTFSTHTPRRLWSGPFLYPVSGLVSSPYGIARSYNGGPVTSFHRGTDFDVPRRTPVIAAGAGRVAYAGPLAIRGRTVIIDHGAGVFSGYHHLSQPTVVVGQTVAAGDLVGYSGASGLVTGPHLHWEVIVNGVEVDPLLWTQEDISP